MQDEVRPISCRGHDSQGGIAITLIDALDTLLVIPSALFFPPLNPNTDALCPSPSVCQSTMPSADVASSV